jgi:hypothetical protein
MPEHQSHLQGTVKVKVQQDVSLEQLQTIIGHIGGMTGYRTCGLVGIDLHLTGDPVETEQLTKLPGVQSVSFGG